MKMKIALALILSLHILFVRAQRTAPDHEKAKGGDITIQPITHATLVLSYGATQIYIDPTGGASAFAGLAAPTLILVTDIHGDHFDPKTLEAINTVNATIIVPQAVADKLPATFNKEKLVILNNDGNTTQAGISITAIPMYNLPGSANAAFHTKGRGNGYILAIGGKNIYISGDTAGIPEMRDLKNIDIAFVCMNLPYTMDVTEASQAVLAFKPKAVYPYHYRGQDVKTFKSLVNAGDSKIDVRLREWYPAAAK